MLVLHPVEPLAAAIVFGAVYDIEAVGAVVVGEALEVRPQMQLAERAGPPPTRLQRLHEGRHRGIERVAIHDQTMCSRTEPGSNRCPGR